MKLSIGSITLYMSGTSHSDIIEASLEGVPRGMHVDLEALLDFMKRRQGGNNIFSTPRKEADIPYFTSGLDQNFTTTGDTLCYYILNKNVRKNDYDKLKHIPRPGHADFPAYLKYGLDFDLSGGSFFSARLTSLICVAGFIALAYLHEHYHIEISSHILSVKGVYDEAFNANNHTDLPKLKAQMDQLKAQNFPCIQSHAAIDIQQTIRDAVESHDSVGGIVECVATGVPAGFGNPRYEGIDSLLAGALFALPAVKGVEIGEGFKATELLGSQHNDTYELENDTTYPVTNHAGGVLGGLANGEPLLVKVACKPTPSIGKPQSSVNLTSKEATTLEISGRHDPCVCLRILPVVESIMALALLASAPQETPFTFGLLGQSLKHSYSPEIHLSFGNYSYQLFEVEPQKLACFLHSNSWRGINVTIPYKKDVIRYCDQLTDEVKALKSANTLIRKDGKLIAYNTDIFGFEYLLERFAKLWYDKQKTRNLFRGKKVLVLGSGGASASVCYVLKKLNAHTQVISRTGNFNYHNIGQFNYYDFIVNTTPVGMYPNSPNSPLSSKQLAGFTQLKGIIDIIYNPAITGLGFIAQNLKIPYINGLAMLVAQAYKASCLFQNTETLPISIEEAVLTLSLNSLHVMLVGMPGVGKSTIARYLAKFSSRPFIDLDKCFEQKYGMKPGQYITSHGEAAFRKKEHEVLKQAISTSKPSVIACGGGTPTYEPNYQLLKQNSIVVYVQRPLNKLSVLNRPLSQKRGVKAIYKERHPIYNNIADINFSLTSNPKRDAKKLLEKLGL